MSYTDQTLNQLVINKLSKTKYQELVNNSQINENELYLVPDDSGTTYTAGTGIDITNDTISVDNTVALKSDLFSGSYEDLTNKPILGTVGYATALPDSHSEADFRAFLENLPILNTTETDGSGITNLVGDGKGDYFFIKGFFLIKPEGATDDKTTWYLGSTFGSVTKGSADKIMVYRNANRGHCFLGARVAKKKTVQIDTTTQAAGTVAVYRFAPTFKGDTVIETAAAQAGYDYINSFAQKISIPHSPVEATPLADVPTDTDGTYVLKATVSNGTVTIDWVLEA